MHSAAHELAAIRARMRQSRVLQYVTLELTYACNLDCFFCYNDRDKPGQPLTLDQYRTLLQDLADMQTLFLMLTGGEPMVHPHFFEIGAMTRELGFAVRVRTNGHNLNRTRAERLWREVEPWQVEVSLHGATAAVHDRQTRVRGSFERLCRNLQQALDVGLNCSVVSTPTRWNQHQIGAMFELCDRIGVPLRFQGPVAPRDNGDLEPLAIQPDPAVWNRVRECLERRAPAPAEDDCGLLASDGEAPGVEATCGVGIGSVDIDPYGNVQACMHLQESAGSLHRQSITEIWHHSPVFSRARSRARDAARRLEGQQPEQFGAPLHCIAVEENAAKGGCGSCSGGCA
jgi:MoaA/NifB/PqqE/SkfB family radical SAM enzyme